MKNKKIVLKFLYRSIPIIIVSILLFISVDFHTDGILISDGLYSIRLTDNKYQIDVLGGSTQAGSLVQAIKITDVSSQVFRIKHIDGDEYALMYTNENMCIAVASDKETVVAQGYDESNDYNKWYIERIGTSQYFLLTNVATKTSLYYEYSNEINLYLMKVGNYDANDDRFRYLLVK